MDWLCESQTTFFLGTVLSIVISAFGLFFIIFAKYCSNTAGKIPYEDACAVLGIQGNMAIALITVGSFMLFNLVVLFCLTFLPFCCKRSRFV